MKQKLRFALVTSVTTVLTACSSLSAGNLFSHYSQQNQAVYFAVEAGQYQEAEELLPDMVGGEILDNLEKGRVTFLNQNYQQSQSYFEFSEQATRVQQDQALISLSESARDIGSLAVNDNLKSYYPADFELGFLHLYLGLNYLKKSSLEGALVEMRKANQVQERAKAAREQDLKSAEREMRQSGVDPNLGSVLSNYPDAGDSLQAVQNGYLLYLSALLYETSGELNNAYVDYRRALAVMPENREIIDGAFRVASALGMSQDLQLLEKEYGKPQLLPKGQSRIIVLDEQGVVLAKQGWEFSLPIYSQGSLAYYSMAVPYYPQQASQSFANIKLDGKAFTKSKLVDVNLMAQQDLTERMPSILIRQALRVVSKEQIRRETSRNNEVGNLLMNVWNVLTEQPDTRGWQTLPAQVYSNSKVVSPGEHTLSFSGQAYKVTTKPDQTILVWMSRQGDSSTIWHKQLGNI
ncbi:COG3014 family protein [Vibrio sp. SCSIO 43137]|uniref:COG3014 family protein n=1 Tax=Vibrio sp. SCSIO 43137 TaxID=3021011 RepID=UPI0023076B17|nr:hypothetical protein [Vibrio sp. SCSIO 43137]WCE28634.1 hypothetical protein PK654_09660 [Vibrio sp. SCSIO 43137]